MSKLKLSDVNIYYGDFHAVQNANLEVPARSVTAFIGPSGCGKSTVLPVSYTHLDVYKRQR